MGKHGVQILDLDVNKLIEMLNGALAEEWLTYYQYWVSSIVIEGPMRPDIQKELLIHAEEEYAHANQLAERIKELEGTPLLSPEEWSKASKYKYESPVDPAIDKVLELNMHGEISAIDRYRDIINFTFGKDHATYQLATEILEVELEHEQELEDWITDIEITLKPHKK